MKDRRQCYSAARELLKARRSFQFCPSCCNCDCVSCSFCRLRCLALQQHLWCTASSSSLCTLSNFSSTCVLSFHRRASSKSGSANAGGLRPAASLTASAAIPCFATQQFHWRRQHATCCTQQVKRNRAAGGAVAANLRRAISMLSRSPCKGLIGVVAIPGAGAAAAAAAAEVAVATPLCRWPVKLTSKSTAG